MVPQTSGRNCRCAYALKKFSMGAEAARVLCPPHREQCALFSGGGVYARAGKQRSPRGARADASAILCSPTHAVVGSSRPACRQGRKHVITRTSTAIEVRCATLAAAWWPPAGGVRTESGFKGGFSSSNYTFCIYLARKQRDSNSATIGSLKKALFDKDN